MFPGGAPFLWRRRHTKTSSSTTMTVGTRMQTSTIMATATPLSPLVSCSSAGTAGAWQPGHVRSTLIRQMTVTERELSSPDDALTSKASESLRSARFLLLLLRRRCVCKGSSPPPSSPPTSSAAASSWSVWDTVMFPDTASTRK